MPEGLELRSCLDPVYGKGSWDDGSTVSDAQGQEMAGEPWKKLDAGHWEPKPPQGYLQLNQDSAEVNGDSPVR